MPNKRILNCQAGSDGDCIHELCPQAKDNEPMQTGRSCPLPRWDEDPEY